MASFFGSIGSSAFSSVVGQKIEKATNSANPSEDWTLIVEICDIINETIEGPKEAIKAIRKRLSNHKYYKSTLYTLILCEACVKNCGPRFHKQIATKEFLNDLTKLLGQKGEASHLPHVVQEKVLSLIQSWSDAFRNAPELQSITTCYESLKAQDYEFPAQDLDTLSPIFTPNRPETATSQSRPATATTQNNTTRSLMFAPSNTRPQSAPMQPNMRQPVNMHCQQATAQINPSPEQLAKLRSELDIVQGNVKVLSEMLSELQPGSEDSNDYELLVELNKTCREMQSRLVQLLNRIANEEVTGVLLHINDDLNNVFIRYDRYDQNRKAVIGEVTEQPDSTMQKEEENSESALINFGDLSQPHEPADEEFDMFAQSRSSTFADSRQCGATYDDNREGVPNEGSIAGVLSAKGPYPVAPPVVESTEPVDNTTEDDIEDVEEWLKGTDLAQLEADEQAAREAALKANAPVHTIQTSDSTDQSLSSSEFDKFLSDRARSGSQRLSEPARQMTNVASAGEKTHDEMFGL